MKALSFKQPWAWLVCAGHKEVDNRSWHIHMPPLLNYPAEPKRIYVHASKTIDKAAFKWIAETIPLAIIQKFMVNGLPNPGMFITGAIIGEVDITGCVEHSDSPWFVGPYGFTLANPVLYDKPIPCKGMLGFFQPDIALPGGQNEKKVDREVDQGRRQETEKWRDGTDMVCSICGEPVFKGQPFNATISHSPKKRNCSHFFCSGGTMTVIGSPEPGVMEITQYGRKQS